MNMKTIKSATEVRNNFFDILTDVEKTNLPYTITREGRPVAVLMNAEEYESWMETMEVMAESPELEKDIEKAEKEYRAGEYVTLDEILAKSGYVLADKGKKYEVSGRRSKKSSKRTK